MALEKAKADLNVIKMYLLDKFADKERQMPDKDMKRLASARVFHSHMADRHNAENPRMICNVLSGSHIVNCAQAIEAVGRSARVGLLIHELAHVATESGDFPDQELAADLWVKEFLPESGYMYCDHLYTDPASKKNVTAKHVEHVSKEFLKKLDKLTKE